MHRNVAVLLTTSALLAAGTAEAQQRGYQGSVGSAWYEMSLDMPGCLAAAGDGLRDAGFLVDAIGAGEQTVFGGRNGTVMAVRCIPGRRIAVVFSHSPGGDDMGAAANSIRDRLAGRATQGAGPQGGSPPASGPQGGGGSSKF